MVYPRKLEPESYVATLYVATHLKYFPDRVLLKGFKRLFRKFVVECYALQPGQMMEDMQGLLLQPEIGDNVCG